ncbi:MAG TPA: branched-chain amino acid ABC transporter permease [Acidimicrobiales bacterium]
MTTLWSGLSLGAVYALVALGYNVVFISSGIFNFAQASLLTLGTFFAYLGVVTLHLNPVLTILMATAGCLIVGLIEERVAIRPLSGKLSRAELVTTVGFAALIEGTIALIWGTVPLQVPFFGSTTVLTIFGGRIIPDSLVLIIFVIVLALALHVWYKYSLSGLASIAVAEDRVAAQLRGINVGRRSIVAFAMGGAIAGLAGILVAPQTYAISNLGDAIGLTAFIAFALGGTGSLLGATIGGLAVGIIEQEVARYVGSLYTNSILYVILLFILLVMPNGLFGRSTVRAI